MQVPGGGLLEAVNEDGDWDEDEKCYLFGTGGRLPPAPAFGLELSDGELTIDVWNVELQAGQLAAMLASAVPMGRPLGLCFRLCGFTPQSFEGCALHLATVEEFQIMVCAGRFGEDLSLQPRLDALFRQTPALCSLTVFCVPVADETTCLRNGLPAAVATLRHLTSLVLIATRLPHLNGVVEGLPGGHALGTCCRVRWPACEDAREVCSAVLAYKWHVLMWHSIAGCCCRPGSPGPAPEPPGAAARLPEPLHQAHRPAAGHE